MEGRLLGVTRSNFKSFAGPKQLRDMKKTAVKDSPTQLKKETDVQEGMAQLQLEENTTTLKPKERKMSSAVVCTRPFKFTIPCKVCAVVGHSNDKCPYMKQSDGSGTALVAIVLSSGVAMAVESRITSLPPLTKTLYPQHKLHIIRDDPPVLAGWCHSNIEGMALINHLKGNAKKKNLKNIVKLGRDYLSTKTERFNVQCYVCSVERGEPLAYIINRFWDTLHLPECDPDAECDSNGCQCTRFKIELNTRQLKFGVYCIGSGAKFAFADLKSSFEGKEDVRSQTGEYNIENLDKGGDFTLDDVGKMLLSAVFEAALHNADCGGPFWVSSIPRFGSIAPQPPCDFVNAYKLFYADLELRHETYIFVIYREGLVGNNYGHFIVQNAVPSESICVKGYSVADLAGGYVLHMMALHEGGQIQQLDALFDPIGNTDEFPDVDLFCKDKSQLKFCALDKLILDGNDHGLLSDDIRELEYVFFGLPTLAFLDSLILDKKAFNFERWEDYYYQN